MHLKKLKKMEHSKIITTGVLSLSAIVVLFTLIMVWKTNDTSVLTVLIPSIEVAFCLTAKHYYLKAGMENRIKLMQTYGEDAKDIAKESPWSI